MCKTSSWILQTEWMVEIKKIVPSDVKASCGPFWKTATKLTITFAKLLRTPSLSFPGPKWGNNVSSEDRTPGLSHCLPKPWQSNMAMEHRPFIDAVSQANAYDFFGGQYNWGVPSAMLDCRRVFLLELEVCKALLTIPLKMHCHISLLLRALRRNPPESIPIGFSFTSLMHLYDPYLWWFCLALAIFFARYIRELVEGTSAGNHYI